MGGLLRYQVFLGYGAVFLAVWYAGMKAESSIVGKVTGAKILIEWAPLWLVLALAIYALGCIGYGMFTSRDFPEAAVELEKEIKEAKLEMIRRGIITD